MPRRIHEQVAEWAHSEAARRLGGFASQAAAGRSDLRSVEADSRAASSTSSSSASGRACTAPGPGGRLPEPTEPPYKGLASFEVEDAEWFFGRERLVADLIARLAGAPLLGVVGPSGSGKSSAVRAGLIPALAAGVLPGSERWITLSMRPGRAPAAGARSHPLEHAAEAVLDRMEGQDLPLRAVRDVLDEGERVVLVVDQFEEVFTACADERGARRVRRGADRGGARPSRERRPRACGPSRLLRHAAPPIPAWPSCSARTTCSSGR